MLHSAHDYNLTLDFYETDTTTKGSHQLDGKDNRSRAFFHIMFLLRNMLRRPKWIILENVQGFLHSDVLRCILIFKIFLVPFYSTLSIPFFFLFFFLFFFYFFSPSSLLSFSHYLHISISSLLNTIYHRYWKTVLHECGYVWRQYLLSPVSSVGLPNHRMR